MVKNNKLIVFQDKNIRRIWYNSQWYFSVVDVVEVLVGSLRPRKYWSELKTKLLDEGFEVSDYIGQLKLLASDGKLRFTDCANTRSLFRIIQSIPSKKLEPFKRWLAKVGYDRIEEIENPELGQDRIKEYYELKGYPNEWVNKRLRGIVIRQELTDEWKNRAIKTSKEFSILTNEISKATFGKTVSEYREFKQLQDIRQNLRDHMTDWELILTMFGEKATTDITREFDSQGFDECKESAIEGGQVANEAKSSIEKRLGKSVLSKDNFLLVQNIKKKLN